MTEDLARRMNQMWHSLETLQLFTLREQVEHKVEYIREQMFGPGRPPVALIGHSIGEAWGLIICNPYTNASIVFDVRSAALCKRQDLKRGHFGCAALRNEDIEGYRGGF